MYYALAAAAAAGVGWPAEGPFVVQPPSVLDMACSCSKPVIKAVDPHKQGLLSSPGAGVAA